MKLRRAELFALLLFAGAIAACGFWKPVHMDDAAFVRVAQQVRSFPGDPYGFSWSYLGEPTPAAIGLPHPPLWPAALGFSIESFGLTPIALHLPAVLACLALALGVARWMPHERERRARWLLVGSPVLGVLAQTSMSDVPALALGLLGLGTFASAQRRGSTRAALMAGVYLAAAGLTRYAALAFAAGPLAAALLARRGAAPRGARARAGIAACVPLAVAALFQMWFAARYGATHFELLAQHARFEDTRAPELRVIAFLPALAIALPAAIAAIGACGGRRAVGSAALLGALAGAWGAMRSSSAHGIACDAAHASLLVILCAAGSALLVVAWRSGRSAEERALIAAVALSLLIATPAGAARYALPLASALAFALRDPLARLSGRAFGAAMTVQLALLAALCAADLRAARATRDAAIEAAAFAAREPRAAWVRGELGLRFELELRGARYLDAHERAIRAGELLVRSERATPIEARYSARVDAALPAEAERSFRADDAFPLRLHQPYAAAGFYGHRAGLLPFAFSRVPHDVVTVHRLREAPDLFDLDRAERLGAAENSELARDFARYARVRPATPHPDLAAEPCLHLVARRAAGGTMALRFAVDLPVRARRLVGRWAEPTRLYEEVVPGGSTLARVRLSSRDGSGNSAAIEARFAARSRPEERAWRELELDLAPWAGTPVWIELACSVPEEEPAADAVAYAIFAALEIETR